VRVECRGAQEGTTQKDAKKRRKRRMRRGDATRGPGSTSTHLNFGPSQGQCGRTIRSPRFFLLTVTSSDFFSSYSRVEFSLSLFFTPV
jgi:3-methyladenine DNA glycosylase Mpg